MPLMIRRIKLDDFINRNDIMWILFEQGNISRPLVALTNYELDRLLISIEEQRNENHTKVKTT